MQFRKVLNVIDLQVRVKFDHFGYLKGILGSIVNLRCPVVHGIYLKGKLGLLPIF